MATINVSWATSSVDAPIGTVIDHADVDLLDGSGNVAQSQPGSAGSGLPASSSFPNVAVGTGYVARLRNIDGVGNVFGADVMTNLVDVTSSTTTVTVVSSGSASVAL